MVVDWQQVAGWIATYGTTVVAVITAAVNVVKLYGQKAQTASKNEIAKAYKKQTEQLKAAWDEDKRVYSQQMLVLQDQVNKSNEANQKMIEALELFVSGSRHSDTCKAAVTERLTDAARLYPQLDFSAVTAAAEKHSEESKSAKRVALAETQAALNGLLAADENIKKA